MKKFNVLILLALGLSFSGAQAARVAVVDSGTDLEHTLLKNNAWVNPAETAGNRVDNDQNGKVDDINGWNFVDQYHRTFFPEHLNYVEPIVYPLMRIIARQQAGTVTEEESRFFDENVTGLPDAQKQLLSQHLNFFGQYVHGTHVSGIVVALNPGAEILSARVFPDQAPPRYEAQFNGEGLYALESGSAEKSGLMDWLYSFLAYMTNGTFQEVGSYINEMEMDVANYSLGMSLRMIAEAALNLRGNSDPTEEEVAAETQKLFAQFEPHGNKWMESAPNTLFVIAAGNDGTDNDVFAAFPANVNRDNAITVAASHGYDKIAGFSNYGATKVHVAAPGVAIESAVPSLNNEMQLPLSGTSMAAPFVTGVASAVKDANPALTPLEMKQILMDTVDHKEWLAGKVVSGGVVNPVRAVKAAELSVTGELEAAIATARTEVEDMPGETYRPEFQPLAPNFEVSEELKQAARQLVF